MNDDTDSPTQPPIRVITRATTAEARQTRAYSVAEVYTRLGNVTGTAQELGIGRQLVAKVLRSVEGESAMAEIRHELIQRQKQRLVGLSDLALDALESTLKSARPESMARVSAASTILDRSGHKPIDRSEVAIDARITDEARTTRLIAIFDGARARRDRQIDSIDPGAD